MKNQGVVIGVGEILFDLLPEGKRLGGAPANFAYHVAQLGCESVAVSAVGRDALGDEAIETLTERGVGVCVERVDAPTGVVRVTLDKAGVANYDICEGVAWDMLSFGDELQALAQRCRAVCFGTLAQRSEKTRQAIRSLLAAIPAANEALLIYDINLRQHYYSKELIESSLDLCNVLKINDGELKEVAPLLGLPEKNFEAAIRELIARHGLRMVVLTCGEQGSWIYTAEEALFQPTPQVEVADTVGAGDSFTATLCASLLQGYTLSEAHRRAAVLAAYVCTQIGAMPRYDADKVLGA